MALNKITRRKLKELFHHIKLKLIEIQVENNFVRALENQETYIDKPDSYFFELLVGLIFQSGIRGIVWERYKHEIRKEFANYSRKCRPWTPLSNNEEIRREIPNLVSWTFSVRFILLDIRIQRLPQVFI